MDKISRSYDRIYPGFDWQAQCADGLYLAAYTWNQRGKSWRWWLQRCLHTATAGKVRTYKRRLAKVGHAIPLKSLELRLYYLEDLAPPWPGCEPSQGDLSRHLENVDPA